MDETTTLDGMWKVRRSSDGKIIGFFDTREQAQHYSRSLTGVTSVTPPSARRWLICLSVEVDAVNGPEARNKVTQALLKADKGVVSFNVDHICEG